MVGRGVRRGSVAIIRGKEVCTYRVHTTIILGTDRERLREYEEVRGTEVQRKVQTEVQRYNTAEQVGFWCQKQYESVIGPVWRARIDRHTPTTSPPKWPQWRINKTPSAIVSGSKRQSAPKLTYQTDYVSNVTKQTAFKSLISIQLFYSEISLRSRPCVLRPWIGRPEAIVSKSGLAAWEAHTLQPPVSVPPPISAPPFTLYPSVPPIGSKRNTNR